jgi:hydrogenase maturation protein HypF
MLDILAKKIHIKGVVQGVGFRPFVYSLALKNNITGWVRNSSNGVEIEINGTSPHLESFLTILQNSPPALSRIDTLSVEDINTNNYKEFTIIESNPIEGEFLPVSPDYSICDDCLQELFDKQNRR